MDQLEHSFTSDEIEKYYQLIGRNVKKYREQKGLTQLDLSMAMGNKSVSLVSAAELCTNGRHFNIEHLYKISKILKVDICELLKISS